MPRVNKYIKRFRLSEAKFRQLLILFSNDIDAVAIASITHLNRKTVNRLFNSDP